MYSHLLGWWWRSKCTQIFFFSSFNLVSSVFLFILSSLCSFCPPTEFSCLTVMYFVNDFLGIVSLYNFFFCLVALCYFLSLVWCLNPNVRVNNPRMKKRINFLWKMPEFFVFFFIFCFYPKWYVLILLVEQKNKIHNTPDLVKNWIQLSHIQVLITDFHFHQQKKKTICNLFHLWQYLRVKNTFFTLFTLRKLYFLVCYWFRFTELNMQLQ